MDNKKVVNLLRAVADLMDEEPKSEISEVKGITERYRKDNIKEEPKGPYIHDQKLVDILKKAKKVSEKADKYSQGLPKKIKEVMLSDSNTVFEEGVEKTKEHFKSLMERIDSSEKIRTYKNKLSEADTKLKKVLGELDELRGEAYKQMVEETKKEKENLDNKEHGEEEFSKDMKPQE